jgi:outer membrane protein assembly factor BamB
MEILALACPQRLLGAVAVSLSISAICLISSTAQAQRVRVRGGVLNSAGVVSPDSTENDDSGPSHFAPPDRKVLQVLARSKKALEEHRYGEALEGLTEILRGGEDYLYQPDRKLSIYRSLKTEAQQLLGQMPREGRELYEVRSGSEARDRLKKAIASGDANALSEISGQFFHTQAGYEAAYLRALSYMDHGAPLAAALTLKRLREAGPAADGFEPGLSLTQAACYYQAGMIDQCRQVLVDLKRRIGKSTLPIDGREVTWFEQEGEAPEWLAKLAKLQRMTAAVEADQWTMFRGDPSRSASTVGSAPLLNLRWQVELAEEKSLADGLRDQELLYRQNNKNVLAGLHPLAVGDRVIMRTATKLLGIDFNNGKRIWEASVAESEQEETQQQDPFSPFRGRNNNMSPAALYGQRIWDDATYGTMSSDGKLVFVVEQLSLGVMSQFNNMMIFGGGRAERTNRGVANRLAAYEIGAGPKDGGKLVWQLGGPDDLRQTDTFFLGPPLPLRGQLYVIAEIKDEIRLLALDAATGNVAWSQQLAMVESSISQDPIRRLAGVSPSYADGILICPTGSGCVVAVDLANHSLLWGYVYPRDDNQGGGRRWQRMAPMTMAFANAQGPLPRWLDGTAMIAGGRVLLTPAEADMLYCVNLGDGKQCWKQPRGEHYYIACVHQDKVVLVGRNGIDAVNLDNGNKAWEDRSIVFPAGASVTGHGFYSGNRYYTPLSSGEVVAVDLDSGKIVAVAKSRKGVVPGNLVCYRGRIISQGLDSVEVYYQLDAARTDSAQLLAKNSDDVEGLTLRGEIALDEGRSTEAVADFRRAYAIDTQSDSRVRTRELLRDALLSGLRDNFTAHRSLAGELEKLLDEPSQKATYLRYMAMGLQRAGEWQQAVDYCMKLVDMDEKEMQPEVIERSYLARRDRWVQARLALLRAEGGAAAAAIDKALVPRLEEAKSTSGFDALRRFLDYFDGQPEAAVARTELIERMIQAGNIMGAEMLLTSAAYSSDRNAKAALLVEMATLNLRANRVGDAAACYRQLLRDFANVPCHAGLTPAAWLAALPNGDVLRKEINRPVADWPKGLVEVNKTEGQAVNPYNTRAMRFDMAFGGPTGPFFTDYTVSFENNQQEIAFRDGWGRAQKPLPVRLTENGRMTNFYNANTTVARCCGHLLLVAAGTKIFGLDPWRASGNASPILWSQDLTDTSGDNGFNPAQIVFNGGTGVFRTNPFGPVNDRIVCFQRVRNLVAVDPMSGERLWVRQDIPQNSEVFGDENYVFVVSPGKAEAAVYRAIDGEYLGDRKLPHVERSEGNAYPYTNSYDGYERNSSLANFGTLFVGRNILTWGRGPQGKSSSLALFDLWKQQQVWPQRTFATGSRVDVVEQDAVGVLEPDGHFVLIDLADGRTISDLKLKLRSFNLTDLAVMRMGDQYIVIAQDRSANNNGNNEQTQPPRGMLGYGLRRARLYAIDLQGRLAWSEPVDTDHHCFLLTQPARLPVLLFGSFRYEQVNNQGTRMRTTLLAVDRRDGRIVYDKNDVGPLGPMGLMALDIDGDPGDKTVRIRANSDNIVLTFTDKPVKSAVRKSSGGPKGPSNLGDALLDAVQRAAGLPERP